MKLAILSLLLTPIASFAQGLDSCVVRSVIQVESSNNPLAINAKTSCFGLMQLQLGTARVLGFKGTIKDLLNPITNKKYGTLYIKYLLQRYNNQLFKALDAYNRGYGNVDAFPYKGEWKQHRYVGLILKNMEKICPQAAQQWQ